MDLKQIKAFLTVAETGHVTRAAEILHLVQPAVSRQLKLLEEDIGVPLFDRQRQGMVLTEAGKSFIGYARRAMLELDRARAEISGAQNGVSGLVTLGLLPSTVEALSSSLVSAVASTYPGIRIQIAMGYAGTLSKWLELGEIDAALLYGAASTSNLQSMPLIEEALWLIGPKSAKLRPNKPITLASLVDTALILPNAPHGIRTLVDHACALAKIQLKICAETNALSVQRSLVLGGHGLTILPPIAVADDLRSQQLTGAPLINPVISRKIVLALPANRPTTRHVQLAVDLLAQTAKKTVLSGGWMEGHWLAD
jgi:LysR family transcriptional regulator, nitrogen assimilation regulatory protein